MSADILLPGLLALAVPLELERLSRTGGPSEMDRDWARAHAWVLAERGDILLYRSGKKGQTAAQFTGLVRALCVLAYMPGGVSCLGLHVCAGVPDSAGAVCHAGGGIRPAGERAGGSSLSPLGRPGKEMAG